MRYWQHDETGRICESETRPSERWDEINFVSWEAKPEVVTITLLRAKRLALLGLLKAEKHRQQTREKEAHDNQAD